MKQASTKNRKISASIRGQIATELEHDRLDTKAKVAQNYGHRKPYSGSQYWIQQEREKRNDEQFGDQDGEV